MKKITNNQLFKTKILNAGDYINVEQIDKITGINHKIILNPEELMIIKEFLQKMEV